MDKAIGETAKSVFCDALVRMNSKKRLGLVQ